jgi:hypothetical protein
MLYGVAWLTGEAAKLYGVKHYKLVYVCVLTFSPAFIYINHVYFDLPLVFLCVLALYVYKRHNNLILALGILGIARYLRKSASIFMLALLIVHIFKIFKTRDKADKKTAIKTVIKKLVVVVAGVVVFSAVYKIPTRLVWNKFVNGNFTGNSSWNMYYIGINEAEFGFMDNDFAKDRSKQDVIDRVKEYGPWRMTKIFVKKTFWLWSQGTYQAQRYGFGSDVQDEDMLTKFEYQTILTNHLLRDDQPLRKILNSVMRDQYYVMFGLMILTMMDRRKTERYRGFYYAFIATFLIMLVYELKSRYVFHLFPLMIVMAVDGTELLEKRLEAFKTNKIKMKQIRNI